MIYGTGGNAQAISTSPWFFIPKPNPQAKIRLFCFPYAGGIAEIYYPWFEEMPDYIEMVAIQYPGHIHTGNDKLYTRLSMLIEDLIAEITPLLDKSYMFFGHSMGALIAYELTRCISERGLGLPEHLFLSARNPPHLPLVYPMIHKMSEQEYEKLIRASNILPEEVLSNRGVLNKILPILIADFEMIETWVYNQNTPPLNIPICSFAGVNDNLALPKYSAEWSKYTARDFKLISFPEKHYFILNREVRKSLIKNIVACAKQCV